MFNFRLKLNFNCFILGIFTAIYFGRNRSSNQQIQKFLLIFFNISQLIPILFQLVVVVAVRCFIAFFQSIRQSEFQLIIKAD